MKIRVLSRQTKATSKRKRIAVQRMKASSTQLASVDFSSILARGTTLKSEDGMAAEKHWVQKVSTR
eukprot:468174-Pleurochrysis_carterae.AAC.1